MIYSQIALQTLTNAIQFLKEVMAILPPALVVLMILDAWIPRHTVESHLGKNSGAKGWLTAMLLGSFAAGPLFTAFPIAQSMALKAARPANVVIFLGAWATVKIPMILMESHFMGARFSLLRLALTIPFLVLMGHLVEKFARDPAGRAE